uniref:Serine/threonine-protein kinase ATM n=1 Tax=Anopheles farauti TaxID=69004 RepID=A0A182QR64_9DIPT
MEPCRKKEVVNSVEKQYDELNDETFGSADKGDWEDIHENLVRLERNRTRCLAEMMEDNHLSDESDGSSLVAECIDQGKEDTMASSTSSGARLSALDRELCSLLIEMQSEKITVRQKAFSKMVSILNNREEDFVAYMDSESFETDWGAVFNAAYQGIQKHSYSSAAQVPGKCQDFILVLQKLGELAMNLADAPRLSYQQLVGCIVHGITDQAMRDAFGTSFLQLLNKSVLCSQWNLTTVSYEQWKDIFECCFVMLDAKPKQSSFEASYLSLAVVKFLDNCSMQTLLAPYLTRVVEHIGQAVNDKKGSILYYLLNVACHCVQAIYWNEDNWKNGNDGTESSTKRTKQFNKLQSVMEMIETDPNTLVILSTIVDRYEGAILRENYLRLLQLLCNIQPTLQTPTEQNAFYRCCSVLLCFEEKPTSRSLVTLLKNDAGKLWSKIVTGALRGCIATGSKVSTESNLLLQLLIRHRKYPDVAFLNGNVLEAFYTYAIEKTNTNVGTLLAILETLGNVACLGEVEGVLAKLFDYLYPQTRETKSKAILHTKEQLNTKVLAKISILCVVTKRTASESDRNDQKNHAYRQENAYREQDKQMQTLEQRLRYHSLDELLQSEQDSEAADASPTISYNVNESQLKQLCGILNFDKHQLPDDNSVLSDKMVHLCRDLELYLEMLNILLLHEAYDAPDKCILYKKILLMLELLNRCCERLLNNVVSLNINEVKGIAERLLSIVRGPYHPLLKSVLLRSDHTMVLRWVIHQIELKKGEDSKCVAVLDERDLSPEQQLKRCLLNTTAEYLQYEGGPCTTEVHDLLEKLKLNVYCSLDLFYLFDLCRILLRQSSHEEIAVWVLQNIIDVCKTHKTCASITEMIMDLYADLASFMAPYENLTRNVTVVLHSFIKQCAKHMYSVELQTKILAQVKYLLRAYPEHVCSPMHETIYLGLVPLLESRNYRIKLEAVKNILLFAHSEWAYRDVTGIPSTFYEFQLKLYDTIDMDDLIANATDENDKVSASIVGKCVAFLLPKYAKCEGMPAKYYEMANRMHKALAPFLQKLDLKEHVTEIINHLTYRLNESTELGKLVEQDLPACYVDEHSISKVIYSACLEHLKQSVCGSIPIKYALLSNLCLKNCLQIERTLTTVKRWLWVAEEPERKTIHLLQYTVLLEHLSEYIRQQKERSFKPYLVRDAIYFFCNIMASFPVLHLATLNSFGRFLEHVVTCDDARQLSSEHLHFIVSSLLEVEAVDPSSNIAHKSLSLLRFLIVQQSDTFATAIGKLNYLPADKRFDELREIIFRQKNVGQECLLSEIKALIRLPNLRFEDLAALRILRSTEALRCLGEIGPIDLGTMLLKSDAKMIAYDETINNSKEAIEHCVEVLLSELNTLLTSKNYAVASITSLVCYKILFGKTFHGLAAKLPTLHPFLGNSTDEVKLFSYTTGQELALQKTLENARIDYRAFVQLLSTTLLMFLGNTTLKKLAEQEHTFAEKLIPLLVQIAIKLFQDTVVAKVRSFVNDFFTNFTNNPKDVQNIFNDLKAIQLMLKIVECVRIHNQLFPQYKIAIDYLPIAQAAHYCQAHFKAIMYGELWCREEEDKGVESGGKKHSKLLEIMKSCHLAVGVNDAVKSFLNPITERTEYYRLERNYLGCLIFQGADMAWRENASDVSGDQTRSLAQTLKDCNLFGLARSLPGSSQDDYECAWRLCDWNVLITENTAEDRLDKDERNLDGLSVQSRAFERAHYKALKFLENRDELVVGSAISEGRRAVAEMFKLSSIESTKHIYHGLCRLRLLQQIEDFGDVHFSRVLDNDQGLLDKWRLQDALPCSDFTLTERLLSQRLSIFSNAGVRAKRTWIPPAIYNTLLHLIHESRLRGNDGCAMRNIALIGKQQLPNNVESVVKLEDAQLNWTSGNRQLARELAREVIDSGKYTDPMVKAVAYRVYGEFMAESHTQDIKSLYLDYFQKAQKCVHFVVKKHHPEQKDPAGNVPFNHSCFKVDRNFTVLHTVAKYADREFVRLSKVVRSQDWIARRTNVTKMEEEAARLKAEAAGATDQQRKDIGRSVHFMQKNVQRDKRAAEEVEHNRRDYLELALCNYLSYAQQTTVESDMVIFRIISLWLNNQDCSKAQETIEETLPLLSSYKFIPVLPQLTPRVGVDSSVGRLVQKLLVQCARDHPHHTLPFVFAQLYAFMDRPEEEENFKKDKRLLGVQEVYKKLKQMPALEKILQQMERMNLALIQLANKTLSSNATFREYTMTKRDLLGQLEHLDAIHCPTMELAVVQNGAYHQRIVGIRRWEPKVIGVGGINAPKKLLCLCLDGTKRTQLVKGKDDMRQDAVMQQVFGRMNILLRHDRETAHRKLSVRTYKVVPLSQQSGILEWCNHTTPIGMWLLAGHAKYRPQDMEPTAARKAFMNNAQTGMTVEKKLRNYLDICNKIRPVFRHYFFEQYLKPGLWFERQQSYTKSVAVSSMIGYVLGIGDRHVQNILIDKRTGEIIHIDFGIAFEMGKNLPTPETIPFRLTRDIVDGMGINGVEGVFKTSCEKTMEVLRNSHTVISTILEVLLYDPLYSWNVLSNKKATRRQQEAFLSDSGDKLAADGGDQQMELPMGGDINVTAERTLMQVEKKLQGTEDDKYISVEGQVQMLIFNATNERNLCQLFAGWQPYL